MSTQVETKRASSTIAKLRRQVVEKPCLIIQARVLAKGAACMRLRGEGKNLHSAKRNLHFPRRERDVENNVAGATEKTGNAHFRGRVLFLARWRGMNFSLAPWKQATFYSRPNGVTVTPFGIFGHTGPRPLHCYPATKVGQSHGVTTKRIDVGSSLIENASFERVKHNNDSRFNRTSIELVEW